MLPQITRLMNMTEDEIMNHPSLLVNAFDHQHHVLFWNHHCEKMFGIKEEEALGKIFEDLVPYIRNNKKMDYLDRALSGESVYIEEAKYEKTEGFYAQVVLPLKNRSGKVVAAVNIVRALPFKERQYVDQQYSVI